MHGHYGSSKTLSPHMLVDDGNCRKDGDGEYVEGSVGAVCVVGGTSGRTRSGSFDYPAMFVSLQTLGSVVIDVDGGRLDTIFLKSEGGTDDQFSIVKGLRVHGY